MVSRSSGWSTRSSLKSYHHQTLPKPLLMYDRCPLSEQDSPLLSLHGQVGTGDPLGTISHFTMVVGMPSSPSFHGVNLDMTGRVPRLCFMDGLFLFSFEQTVIMHEHLPRVSYLKNGSVMRSCLHGLHATTLRLERSAVGVATVRVGGC